MSLRHVRPASPLTDRVIEFAAEAMLEDLEPRQLMANDPLAVGTLNNGGAWLNVVGTTGDDAITVSQPIKGTYTIANGTWTVMKKGTFVGVRVAAGAGNDSVTITGPIATRTSVLGEAGNDTLVGGAGADLLNGGVGDDGLTGNAGDDGLYGDAGNDSLSGNAGNDKLYGQAGDDALDGGDGNDGLLGDVGDDVLTGGLGNDVLTGSAGADAIAGNDGNDTLNGEAGVDSLAGGAGNDSLNGGLDDDALDGAAGNDLLVGGAGVDALDAGDGNDTLNGEAGNDSLLGGAGADVLNGGLDNDTVDGGADNDRLVADLGGDAYAGGGGLDTLDYTGRTAGLTITLDGGANDGQASECDNVGDDLESIVGGHAADVIVGNDDANTLVGGLGNDTIRGGGGADKLVGGAGLDSLEGEAGNDTLAGGADADALLGGDDDDLLEGGAGNDQLFGGAGRDSLIAIGGGILDSVTGGDGLDGFWLDSDATERALDADAAELAARAVHRVRAFVNAGAAAVTKEVLGQKFADPVGTGKLINFAGNKLFADAGPGADDIGQGSVGDCWYLSGLSAIAKTMPEVIRQSVTSLGDGTFAVRFFNGAAEQYVRVDADLHTYAWSATTQTYARTGAEGSLWAPIMEKALTWVRGNKLGQYATISSGWMSETNARLGLTSTNVFRGGLSNVGSMIDWLKGQLDAGKAVTMGTNAVAAGSGLVGYHAYSVDRVTDHGDGTFSVTVRNPWGSDGSGTNDGANDGHVTLTAATLFANYTGLTAAA